MSTPPLVAVLPFLLLAGVWVARAIRFLRRAEQSKNWERVTGTIIGGHTTGTAGAKDEGIRYSYTFGGRTYESASIRFVIGSVGQNEGSVPRANYTAGSSVTIYVDPSDPAVSVVIPGARRRDVVYVMMAALLALAVGLAWCLFARP